MAREKEAAIADHMLTLAPHLGCQCLHIYVSTTYTGSSTYSQDILKPSVETSRVHKKETNLVEIGLQLHLPGLQLLDLEEFD